ncbi:MAG: ISKra4 family transposase [Planctomycetota bacterium]
MNRERVYQIEVKLEEFRAAGEQFEAIMARLQSDETARMEHGDLEELLNIDGRELLRRLLQGHLDLRAAREKRLERVEDSDGVIRPHFRKDTSRGLSSIFGDVEVNRKSYSDREISSLFPQDAELNLSEDKYSHGLRRRVVEQVAQNSFAEAKNTVLTMTGQRVNNRQEEELTIRTAHDFEAFYAQRASGPEETNDLLVMSTDGKGVVMIEKDLREVTRRAAKRNRRKRKKKRLSKGEKRGRKRMSTVASVYSVPRFERTAEDVMRELNRADGEKTTKKKRPRPQNKRVWASLELEPEEVMDAVFQEALRRDPEQRREWVMLVDGDPYQLQRIRACAKRYGVKVTVVLDFIHVLEYVWKASYSFHPDGSPEAEAWVTERALRILEGKSSEVAAGMRRSATLRELSAKKRKAVDKCANYLIKYRKYLRYDVCLAQGFPIATGVIEGACRHLIKDRMDLTGARWGLAGAEGVLRIRSLRSSGDFDEYWRFHLQAELARNHERRFSETTWHDMEMEDAA